MGRPRFTREVMTADEQIKMAVMILPDSDTSVVLSDDAINFAVTLDPKAAHQLGRFLIHAAQIAAFNALDPHPVRPQLKDANDH
jgi:hypothetical protein